MKKIVSLATILLLAAILCACGAPDTEKKPDVPLDAPLQELIALDTTALGNIVLVDADSNGTCAAMSIVCMNQAGDWGIATNVDFTFVVATEAAKPQIYLAKAVAGTAGEVEIEAAGEAWLTDYLLNVNERTE